jgi:hypothetical protein
VTSLQWGAIPACLAALAVAGCSGGDEPSGRYKSADVERLADVAPVTPGWPPWPHEPDPKEPSSESPDEAAARDPIYAEYRRRTAELEQSADWSSGNKWSDEDKLANFVVGALDTSADAHAAFVASNYSSRAYGAKYGFVVKAEQVDGLGEEAWRLWVHGNGRQVTYHWRRDNLVVEAHLHCYGECPPDTDAAVDAAARAWAEAIDEAARTGES